jgi:ketol-acid reductoisomerase
MTRIYYDADADLTYLHGETVAVLGYGNQGRSQALNLRDSGVQVVVGNVRDESWDRAAQDSFRVLPLAEAAAEAGILMLLLPDEVQRQVYSRDLAARLRPGQALCFAHGYNIRYGLIRAPDFVDVIMVAPRMIGVRVREAFLAGGGVPAFMAVAQEGANAGSGRARRRALALARGIGCTRAGVIECTFAQETELDLFSEQALWPWVFKVFTQAFEFLVAEGYPAEMVALELYASGEASEVFRQMARTGFFKQMVLHSHTSQYGTLTRERRLDSAVVRAAMKTALEEIRGEAFAREWAAEQQAGYPLFEKLKAQAYTHPLNAVEETLAPMIRLGEK